MSSVTFALKDGGADLRFGVSPISVKSTFPNGFNLVVLLNSFFKKNCDG
jgi:hypothetical protein